MSVTFVILTYNEEIHIARAIASVQAATDRIFVIDSGSSDATVEIAQSLGATVLVNPFVSQAQQLNWALNQLPKDTEWVFRLDADETISSQLSDEICEKLPLIGDGVAGICLSRRIKFMGQDIRWGGLFPIRLVRLFRHGRGVSEERWMDEHIVVDGCIANFSGEIVDDNLNTLSWWIDKHNYYASREAIEMLDLEFGFLGGRENLGLQASNQARGKRWIKDKIYARLPSGFRAAVYFLYRFVIRLGFLDGRKGAAFHILQGFWYRYLVDQKLLEAKDYMRKHGVDAFQAAVCVLGFDALSAVSSKSGLGSEQR